MAIAKIGARWTGKGDLLTTAALAFVWGHDAAGRTAKMELPLVDIKAYGVKRGGTQSPATRRSLIQAAINATAAAGLWLTFAGVEYVCNGALQYPTNATIYAPGGEPTFKLSDDAPELENAWEPATRDGTTRFARFIGDFIVDGNFSRPTVTGETFLPGAPRPAASCFVTAGSQDCDIFGRIRCVNGVLHGFDHCSGGEIDEDGTVNYVTTANQLPNYWPTNMARRWYVQDIEAENCGDDCITGHYGEYIRFGRAVGRNAGNRHPSEASASNAIEVDDGCRFWHFDTAEGHNSNRGISTKSHSGLPSPYGVTFGNIKSSGCTNAVWFRGVNTPGEAKKIHVDRLEIWAPAMTQTASPLTVVGLNVYGAEVQINSIHIRGPGANQFTVGGVDWIRSAIRVEAQGYLDAGSIDIEDWATGNVTVANAGGIVVTTDALGFRAGFIHGKNLGYRAIQTGSNGNINIQGAHLRGESLAGSRGILTTAHPSTNGNVFANLNISGFEQQTQYDTRTSSRGSNVIRGDIVSPGGYIHMGGVLPVDRHQLTHQTIAAGTEHTRIDTPSAVVAQFYTRTGAIGAHADAASMKIGGMDVTNRAITSGGTFNALGADYAEYHQVKPLLYGKVVKGAILGFAADGLLTDRYADVVGRFVVKSTDPAMVGGDAWGTPEKICAAYNVEPAGDRPEMVSLDFEDPDQMEAARINLEIDLASWSVRQTAFEVSYQNERAKWDRIAKAGYVPVNLAATLADIGKYLVPCDDGDGGVTANLMAEADLSLLQYIRSIGTVLGVTDDGRPLVEVKVG